jgi:DNA-binding IclR family transcriptional regulator
MSSSDSVQGSASASTGKAGDARDRSPAAESGKSTASGGFARSIRLLDEIVSHGPLRFAELQERLSVPKASLHRALHDLQAERLVQFDDRSLTYSAGYRVLELANRVWARSDLRTLASDQLEKLARLSDETVQLSVLADNHAVYIDSVESTNNVRMSMSIGNKVPVYCTGAGKVLLAGCTESEQRDIISRIQFAVFTPNTITRKEQLMAELAAIKARGYADDNEEHFAGIRCVAAAIVDSANSPVAAISITAPTFRTENERIEQWRQWLMTATSEISMRLSPMTRR